MISNEAIPFWMSAQHFVPYIISGTFPNDLLSSEKINAPVSVYTPFSEKSQGR
jgi:hypothetical protein